MTLRNQLNDNLLKVKDKVLKAEEAYKYCFSLIQSFFANELIDDDLNRIFALKKVEIESTYEKLEKLTDYYKAFENHKDIISGNDRTIKNTFELLIELKDEFNNLIAEIQGFAIFLENSLKEKQWKL